MTASVTLDAPATDTGESAGAERTTPGFVHLHVHTEFSKQDGLARLGDAAASAAADGQPALASTDHGNQAGAWKFVKACKKAGIKPILGVEAYMALVPETDWNPVDEADAAAQDAGVPLALRPGVRFQRTTRMGMDAESGKEKKNTNNHLTILARNEAGWRNLCAIMNKAENSFFHKALIDYALLKEHGEGLIILSGCLGGPVASHAASARRALRTVNDLDFRRLVFGERAIVEAKERHNGKDPLSAERIETIRRDAMDAVQPATETEIAEAQVAYETGIENARTNLGYLVECVGAENVYVEIMEHGLEAEGKEHIKILAGLASDAGLRVVATNDSHYVNACDCDAHDSWLVNGENARGSKVAKDDPNRWRFNGEGYWMRTEAEMRAIYPKATTWQKACDETVRLAERIDDDVIPFTGLRLPRFPVPADVVERWEASGATADERRYKTASAFYLHDLVLKGAKERYDTLTPDLKARLAFEEGVITGMGLEDYFLIVWDVLAWARSDRGMATAEHPFGVPGAKKPILVGPGRGSAAGSAISYCLRIVMVEPLDNGLLFERFLDVARIGMPDIDVDFEAARRDEVYDYLVSRYGAEYIARIGAFQVAKTKRAIKDAARVYDLVALGEKMAKAVPVHQGSPQTFARIFEEEIDKETGRPKPNPEAQEFRDMVATNGEVARIVDLARSFENVVAGEGIHAAGVIISDEPLTDLIPMRRLRDKQGNIVGVPIALWDGKDIDDFGMLKLDALSLRNLDIIAAAVEHIADTTGEVIDPDALPDPDSDGDSKVDKAFQILRDGRTSGIFQLESSGITELCEEIAPTAFSDLSALVALYRPGPMGAGMHTMYARRKNGREDVDYGIFTDDLSEENVIKSVLDDTFGVIAYQEQMMILAEVVAGFSADEKNKLRKAFSKKDRPAMEALKDTFVTQGQQQMTLADGTDKIAFAKRTLENLWVTFDASAEYLFNKSHSAAYGFLSYVTAYLKGNWPTQYGAGILGVTDKADKRLPALFALNQDGIEVLPPDINRSKAKTAPDPENPDAVRLGLTEIRDVGNNGTWVQAERDKNGPFASLRDLMSRVKVPDKDGNLTAKLSVTAVEGLIEAGAFDTLGLPRLGLMLALRATGFDNEVAIPDAEWSPLERSARQRVRLGIALGDHPMRAYKQTLLDYVFNPREDRFGNEFGGRPSPLHRVEQMPRGNMLTVGVLTSWAEKTTRKGGKLANFTLEGTKASMQGTVFNETIMSMRRTGTTPQVGDIVALAGAVKTRTVTNIEIDPETGEEVEESREVRELTGSFMDIVQVDTRPEFNLPEVPDDERVRLADVIPFAKIRAEKVAIEKKEAAAAARKAKKATATTSTKTTAAKTKAPASAASVGAQEVLFHGTEIEDFTDEELDRPAPIFVAGVDEDPEGDAPPLVEITQDVERPWAGMIWVKDDQGLDPIHPADPDVEAKTALREGFDVIPRSIPGEVMDAAGHVFRVSGGCRGCCTNCTEGTREQPGPCIHHGGTRACDCPKTCTKHGRMAGRYVLVIVAPSEAHARAVYGSITMSNPSWEPVNKKYPHWQGAPLVAFAAPAEASDDVPVLPDDVEDLIEQAEQVDRVVAAHHVLQAA